MVGGRGERGRLKYFYGKPTLPLVPMLHLIQKYIKFGSQKAPNSTHASKRKHKNRIIRLTYAGNTNQQSK